MVNLYHRNIFQFRYGWVLGNDEIPKDLGKKGRWKELGQNLTRNPDDLDNFDSDVN